MEAQWHRVGAYVLCRDDFNRVLLVRCVIPGHRDDGRWTLPGGGMEWGERPEETARRELAEETGLEAKLGPIIGVHTGWYDAETSIRGVPGQHVGIVFEASEPVGDLRVEAAGASTDAVEWFTVDEARDLPAVDLLRFALDLL